MLVRELFVKMGLSVDEASFAKGEAAGKLVADGLEKLADKAVEAVKYVIELAKSTAEAGHEIEATAQATGLSTTALQQWHYAASTAGVDASAMDTRILRLSTAMMAAKKGTGEQANAFHRLGIKVSDASGKLRNADDVMMDMADAFSKMEDGSTKVALANEVLGRGGARMIPVFNKGREAIGKLRGEATIMSEDMIKSSAEYVGAQKELENTATGLLRQAVGPLIPMMTKAVKGVSDWVKQNKSFIKQGIAKVMGGILAVVKALGKTLAAMVTVLEFAADHWRLLAVILGSIVTAALIANGEIVLATAGYYLYLGQQAVIAAAKASAAWIAANAASIGATGAIAVGIAGIVAVLDDLIKGMKNEDSHARNMAKSWTAFFDNILGGIPRLSRGWRVFADMVAESVKNMLKASEAVSRFLGMKNLAFGQQEMIVKLSAAQRAARRETSETGTLKAGDLLSRAGGAGERSLAAAQLPMPKMEAFVTEGGGKAPVYHLAAPSMNAVVNIAMAPGETDKDAAIRAGKVMREHLETIFEQTAAATPATE